MKNLLAFGFLFLFSICVAQPPKVDSLKACLEASKADTNRVRILVTLGRIYGMTGDYNTCYQYSREALRLAEQLGYVFGQAISTTNLAIIYKEKADYAKSLEYNFKALRLREQLGDKKAIAGSLNNIAIVYKELREYDKALDYNRRSLEMKEQVDDKYGIAASLNNMAVIYRLINDEAKTLEYNLKALEIRKSIRDEFGMGQSLNNIGNGFTRQKQYDKAKDYLFQSLEIRKKVQDWQGIAMAYQDIACMFMEQGQLNEAQDYAMKSAAIAKQYGFILELKNVESTLTGIYEKMGKHKEALAHYMSFITLRDSIYNEENTKKLVRAEMNFEFEKKEAAAKLEQEKRDAISLAEQNKQRAILWGVSGVLVLALLFALFVYRSYLQKKKANIEIERQKAVIEEKQKEIVDSIYYARRIQNSLLPSEKYIHRNIRKSQGS